MSTDIGKEIAKRVIKTELENLNSLLDSIDDRFNEVIKLLVACRGRIIVSGIGKSAIIAQKMVGTLNSTGSPAIFLHAADAIHGDAGMITPEDILISISKSGASDEVTAMAALVKSYGNKIIAMTADVDSQLASMADAIVYTPTLKEADRHDLVPSSSTTVQIAMADAIAICLLEHKGFEKDDFARVHPGGNIGKRLLLKVKDLCNEKEWPSVLPDAPLPEVFLNITKHRLGATIVLKDYKIIGIITDGDLRRMLMNQTSWSTLTAGDIMTSNPKTIDAEALAVEAVAMAKLHKINQVVVTKANSYFGILHLHDLIREGLV